MIGVILSITGRLHLWPSEVFRNRRAGEWRAVEFRGQLLLNSGKVLLSAMTIVTLHSLYKKNVRL